MMRQPGYYWIYRRSWLRVGPPQPPPLPAPTLVVADVVTFTHAPVVAYWSGGDDGNDALAKEVGFWGHEPPVPVKPPKAPASAAKATSAPTPEPPPVFVRRPMEGSLWFNLGDIVVVSEKIEPPVNWRSDVKPAEA